MKRTIIGALAVALGAGGALSGLLASRAGASGLPAAPPVAAPPVAASIDEAPAPSPPEPAPSAAPARLDDGPPTLASEPPAAAKTSPPKHADWKAASPVRLTRSNDARCSARRLREWIRIDCDIPAADSVALLAGSRAGVEVWTSELEHHGAVIVFPVRRGDRRVLQVNESAGKYGVDPSALVSEAWVEGEDIPTITIQHI